MPFWGLAVLLLSASCATAVYLPLEDVPTSYPLLREAGTDHPLRWSTGRVAALRLSSEAVRISNKGVRFVPPVMKLHTYETGALCTPSPGAFCQTPGGTTLFPEEASAALIPGRSDLVSDPFGEDLASETCSSFSGRQIVDTEDYTATLCDITQKGFDFLAHDGYVNAALRVDSLWFYFFLSVATVILVTSVAQNIANLLGEDTPPGKLWLELLAVLTLLALSWFDIRLATGGDVIFYFFCIGYVVFGVGYWVARRAVSGAETGVPVNVLLGAILLTLCRLYDGIECVFLSPVLFALLVRAFHRGLLLVAPTSDPAPEPILLATQASVWLDFLLAGVAHQYGFRVLFSSRHEGDLLFAVLVTFAAALSLAIVQKKNKKDSI